MNPDAQIAKLQTEVERLRKQITTDELTGLLNRRGIFLRLEPMVTEVNYQLSNPERRRKIEIRSLAVVMSDIDNFKKINDTYGHPTGDKVLKQLGKVIQKRVRSIDVIGRLGGEEFLVGFLGTDKVIAKRLAEDLRQIVENTKFTTTDDEVIPVTASFGVVELSAGMSLQDMIDAADKALYEAKAAGRNRVVVAK